jgi:hypothetical protein
MALSRKMLSFTEAFRAGTESDSDDPRTGVVRYTAWISRALYGAALWSPMANPFIVPVLQRSFPEVTLLRKRKAEHCCSALGGG